ncbi:metallophosphoesterase, partial [Xanthovirga aplysinae]|uniref:metallophosphoesterase n=1 Tax=Xanthovirga aplysinae TaxID=2529853 RepID=UPI0012BD0585
VAAIGDYGDAGPNEQDVANLIDSWNVDAIITLGDNNYDDGEASTIDRNIGQYFSDYIYPYLGSYGSGASSNKFWPSLGNHDYYTTNAQPYLDYFDLPGNERYYDFILGEIHFFAVNSNDEEPDGIRSTSRQARWLQDELASSNATWKIVYFHHAPYSSGNHGNNSDMQWPFADWGADAVIAGHDHHYERIIKDEGQSDELVYFVNGLGGRSRYDIYSPINGSKVRYNDDYGAMLIEASSSQITFEFYEEDGQRIDSYTLTSSGGGDDDDGPGGGGGPVNQPPGSGGGGPIHGGGGRSSTASSNLMGSGETVGHEQRAGLFPNPVGTHLIITLNESDHATYQIKDLQGKMVKEGNLDSVETTIDITTLKKGVYILDIKEGEEVSSRRFMKQ